MMKKLLNKNFLFVLLFNLYFYGASAQIAATFINVPDIIEEDGDLDPSDPIIIEIDNIPNGNTSADVGGNLRFVPNGSESGANLTAAGLNLVDGVPDGPIGSNPPGTIVTAISEAGTLPNTFKRTFTFTNLTPRPTVGTYPISTSSDPSTQYYLIIRILRDTTTPMNADDTASDPGQTGSIESVANTTLAISDFNTEDISSQIYPSPAVDVLNIGEAVETETYQVIDISGATVLTLDAATANGSLSVAHLSSGIYFLVTDAGVAKFTKL